MNVNQTERRLELQDIYTTARCDVKRFETALDAALKKSENYGEKLLQLFANTLELFDGYKIKFPIEVYCESRRKDGYRYLSSGFVFGVYNIVLDDHGFPLICCSFQEKTAKGHYVVRYFQLRYETLTTMARPISDRPAKLMCANFAGCANPA